MTGQKAITVVCNILASASLGVQIFKNNREDNFPGNEYIVVNHLPFSQESGLQEGYVNINTHVKDTDTGEADSARIDEISNKIAPLFKETEDAECNLFTKRSGVEYSLYDDSFSDDEDKTHYQNFKIKVTYYN